MADTRERRRGKGTRIAIVACAALLLGGIAAALVLAASWGSESGTFTVACIDVVGNAVLTADEVVALSEVSLGVQLLEVDPASIESRLAESPRITRARVHRSLPDCVEISLEETLPAAIVQTEDAGFLEVSDRALVLPAADRSAFVDLPLISGVPAPPQAGKRFEDELVMRGLEVLSRARAVEPSFWMDISEVRFAPGSGLVIYTVADGAEIRFGLGAVNSEDLSNSWKVLTDLRDRGAVARSIDLRFDGQVVVRLAERAARPRTQEGGSA